MSVHDFDEIRPYYGEEIPEAIRRVVNAPELKTVLDFLMPEADFEQIKEELLKAKTKLDFQRALMDKVLRTIEKKYTRGVTARGIDTIPKDKAFLFLANHRDIFLDSSFLAMKMLEAGLDTSEMTWGDNLMVSPFIVDVGKINGMVTVFREGTPRELLKNSQRLSAFIRKAITERNKSVWLAHHKGRAKDGNDTTDESVLKMLVLSGGKKPVIDKLKELNPRVATISYEWEPCDARKVKELYHSKDGTYVKEEMEDLESIIGGVLSPKGRVHINVSEVLNLQPDEISGSLPVNETISKVAGLVDNQIFKDYKLWPANYLAYDMLNNTSRFESEYNRETKEMLEQRYQNTVRFLGLGNTEIKEIFLSIYANPVKNKIKNGFLKS